MVRGLERCLIHNTSSTGTNHACFRLPYTHAPGLLSHRDCSFRANAQVVISHMYNMLRVRKVFAVAKVTHVQLCSKDPGTLYNFDSKLPAMVPTAPVVWHVLLDACAPRKASYRWVCSHDQPTCETAVTLRRPGVEARPPCPQLVLTRRLSVSSPCNTATGGLTLETCLTTAFSKYRKDPELTRFQKCMMKPISSMHTRSLDIFSIPFNWVMRARPR